MSAASTWFAPSLGLKWHDFSRFALTFHHITAGCGFESHGSTGEFRLPAATSGGAHSTNQK